MLLHCFAGRVTESEDNGGEGTEEERGNGKREEGTWSQPLHAKSIEFVRERKEMKLITMGGSMLWCRFLQLC